MKQGIVVVFRADGSGAIGLGHLFRSAALSDMVAGQFQRWLVYRSCPSSVLPRMQQHFDKLVEVSDDEMEVTASGTIVVLDGYHFDVAYQQQLIKAGARVVSIDDLHATSFVTDVVINHAPLSEVPAAYDLAPHTTLAYGLGFSLLRPAYLQAMRRPTIERSRSGYLISFGGGDPENITTVVIDRLIELGKQNDLYVILGSANTHRNRVQEALNRYGGRSELLKNLEDHEMIELLDRVSIAFLPASTTLVEAVAIGTPIVSGYYINNQLDLYQGYQQKGLIYGIGSWKQPDDLLGVIDNCERTGTPEPISQQVDHFCDVNLEQIFGQLAASSAAPLVCRLTQPEDMDVYYRWVNDTAVRQSALQSEPIPYAAHQTWFTKKLKDQDTLMMVFYYQQKLMGQVRFDRTGPNEMLLDYSIDEKSRGQGLAKRMLRLAEHQLRSRRSEVGVITAVVKEDNTPSLRTLLALDYQKDELRTGTVHLSKTLTKV